jgi:hypothetical protein
MKRENRFIIRRGGIVIRRVEYRPRLNKWDAIITVFSYSPVEMAKRTNKARFDTLLDAACFAHTAEPL